MPLQTPPREWKNSDTSPLRRFLVSWKNALRERFRLPRLESNSHDSALPTPNLAPPPPPNNKKRGEEGYWTNSLIDDPQGLCINYLYTSGCVTWAFLNRSAWSKRPNNTLDFSSLSARGQQLFLLLSACIIEILSSTMSSCQNARIYTYHRSDKSFIFGWFSCEALTHICHLGDHPLPTLL